MTDHTELEKLAEEIETTLFTDGALDHVDSEMPRTTFILSKLQQAMAMGADAERKRFANAVDKLDEAEDKLAVAVRRLINECTAPE